MPLFADIGNFISVISSQEIFHAALTVRVFSYAIVALSGACIAATKMPHPVKALTIQSPSCPSLQALQMTCDGPTLPSLVRSAGAPPTTYASHRGSSMPKEASATRHTMMAVAAALLSSSATTIPTSSPTCAALCQQALLWNCRDVLMGYSLIGA